MLAEPLRQPMADEARVMAILPLAPGRLSMMNCRFDYEYERNGTANLFKALDIEVPETLLARADGHAVRGDAGGRALDPGYRAELLLDGLLYLVVQRGQHSA